MSILRTFDLHFLTAIRTCFTQLGFKILYFLILTTREISCSNRKIYVSRSCEHFDISYKELMCVYEYLWYVCMYGYIHTCFWEHRLSDISYYKNIRFVFLWWLYKAKRVKNVRFWENKASDSKDSNYILLTLRKTGSAGSEWQGKTLKNLHLVDENDYCKSLLVIYIHVRILIPRWTSRQVNKEKHRQI